MFIVDYLILLAAILILLGIVSSKLSARLGLPVLVLFLLIGMLAGEDGLGGVVFDNAEVAYILGTLALAMILFDGGLQTPLSSVRLVWKPASALATVGVLITASVTGLAAAYILDLPLLQGLLIGAIVGSTDAAAVFSLLRNAGIHLNEKLKATLEIESASNDPMAIFLTVGLLEVLVNSVTATSSLLTMFVLQMGVGAIVGLAIGWLSVRFINRINLSAAGLYPVLVSACGLLSFGIAANLGGSGFLAIFITGVVIGNSRFVFQRSTLFYHDGVAWLSQITMFVMLGLLINPSSLLDVWFEGLLIALVLTLLARPLAVVPLVKAFGFNWRETTLVSWVGLRGSVPIILAIFPLVFGLPGAELIFNVVFFVVLISAIVQGSTLPWVANKLGLMEAPPVTPAATLEITSIGDADADIVAFTLSEGSRTVGRRLSQLALPAGTVVAMITRGNTVIAPRGSTMLKSGDHLFIVVKPEARPLVDTVFSSAETAARKAQLQTELLLKGTTCARDVLFSYGIEFDALPEQTLEEILYKGLADQEPEQDTVIQTSGVELYVREVIGRRIITVGLLPRELMPDDAAS